MTHAAFDYEHRLTTDKITKRIEGKIATEVALYQSIKYVTLNTINCVYHVSVACSTGSYTSILSAFQSSVIGSGGGGGGGRGGGLGQAGDVKKRGREGRGEGSDRGRVPIDYNMLPGSTHGLMDEGRIYGKEENENNNQNENGSRNESKREKNDLNNNNNDDDEVTITLSPSSSPMHTKKGISSTLTPSSSSSSSIDVSESGKTTYSFLPNIPTAHTDIENSISSEIFFKAEGINVLCGEVNLFSSDGLMLQLKRLQFLF